MVIEENEKSRNMQYKLGYKDEGIRRKRYLCLATNDYVDECITGLLKEEFVDINKQEEVMEYKYKFFIAGRTRNRENILNVCKIFEDLNISHYSSLSLLYLVI